MFLLVHCVVSVLGVGGGGGGGGWVWAVAVSGAVAVSVWVPRTVSGVSFMAEGSVVSVQQELVTQAAVARSRQSCCTGCGGTHRVVVRVKCRCGWCWYSQRVSLTTCTDYEYRGRIPFLQQH